MHLAWKLYLEMMSPKPGVQFIDVSPWPQALFWMCVCGLGLLGGALFFAAAKRGPVALLWRFITVAVVLVFCFWGAFVTFRWEKMDMLELAAAKKAMVDTRLVPLLSVFLPAMLLCMAYLVHFAFTKCKSAPPQKSTAGTPGSRW